MGIASYLPISWDRARSSIDRLCCKRIEGIWPGRLLIGLGYGIQLAMEYAHPINFPVRSCIHYQKSSTWSFVDMSLRGKQAGE